MGSWSLSQQLRCRVGTYPGPKALPPQAALTHPHSPTLGQFRHTYYPHMHIFVMWEELGVPRENSHRHGENMQTAHRQWPLLEIHHFSLISIMMKWHWVKQCNSRTCSVWKSLTDYCWTFHRLLKHSLLTLYSLRFCSHHQVYQDPSTLFKLYPQRSPPGFSYAFSDMLQEIKNIFKKGKKIKILPTLSIRAFCDVLV